MVEITLLSETSPSYSSSTTTTLKNENIPQDTTSTFQNNQSSTITTSSNINKANPTSSTRNDNNIPSSSSTTTTTTKSKPQERYITLDLIRKRSEHNESLVSNLEEIALHQEELQSIGPIIGRTCGKTLRILLLQNNVISRLHPAEMKYMKRLEYLNMALNNIRVVEGLECCEFLEKLDLTLNFIDVEGLKESVDCLRECRSLKELYLLGNPCMGVTESSDGHKSGVAAVLPNKQDGKKVNNGGGWLGCRPYVVARLPNLQTLDGKQITRSERILANQKIPTLIQELDVLAKECRKSQKQKENNKPNNDAKDENGEEYTEHTPEARIELSNKMYQQKMEKEENERANQPRVRGEKEFEEEQRDATAKAREREERGDIRQCNEGKWMFQFDEETKPGYVLLDVSIQKHLSSSLIDVDVHPTYVSIVVKSKVLRLVLPAEVKSQESTAQRSTTTGHLLLCMPKVDPEENMITIRASIKNKARIKENDEARKKKSMEANERNEQNGSERDRSTDRGLASDMLREATERLGSVRVEGLVKPSYGGVVQEEKRANLDMQEISSRRKLAAVDDKILDSDEPPPLF